ncbi:alpha-glucosidase [Patella vulgata]|uniref:alpha-glucosidase n=1 Tax=Patella vulgata TaxID=6465 RepID=UPI00217FE948|nr:alpha-glucosidase [Patella vulgata]XP_055957314.1 alpha-glucosidase [Patella vulgata]
MDKTGIYVVSHKPLDESGSGVDNPTFDAIDDKHQEVHFNKETPHYHSDKPYRGMGKDELLTHSSKGIWKTLRYIGMIIVFLVWFGLIITVIALVLVYPRCREPANQVWWQKKTAYRVYVRSFKDSGSDGIGDLNGIFNSLNYLKSLGVGILSLSPIYQQANKNSDYHIINHKEINPEYGTMDDFKALVNATHERGMYLIMDFIPGFTSIEHPWFDASKDSSRNNSKRNFYLWADGAAPGLPPSNWKSIYDGSAWTFDNTTNKYYLHQREVDQPDLNLRSNEVKEEMERILKFWLDLGVDGFYVRESAMLIEDYDLRDEHPSNTSTTTDPDAYDYYDHKYTYGRPENFDYLSRWRYVLNMHGNATGREMLLFADVMGDLNMNMAYYGMNNRDGVNFPLNRPFQQVTKSSDAKSIYTLLRNWLDSLPAGRWSNWLGGDENVPRFSKSRAELNRPLLFLTMLLPGTPMVYYGDEIGMVDSRNLSSNAWSRDQPMRAPMQWDNSSNAGFCNQSCIPWLPVNSGYENNTVQALALDGKSIFNLFKNLTTLREKASFQFGYHQLLPQGDGIIAFVRYFDGKTGYIVAVNVANKTASYDFSGTHESLPELVSVVLTTNTAGTYSVGDELSPSGITLLPYEGIVGSWKYVAKEL